MIGDIIKKLRCSKYESMDGLANDTGISRSYLYEIERMDNMDKLSVQTLEKICKAFDINLSMLLLHISKDDDELVKSSKSIAEVYINRKIISWSL